MAGTLLVPLDGSDDSVAALDYALELAPGLGADLRLLWAWEGFVGLDRAIPYPEQEQVTRREVARRLEWLDDVGHRRCTPAGVRWACSAPVGPPAAWIAREARRMARYVVMTMHGRGGFERWRIGSVADEVARLSQVPVIFARPTADERQRRPPRRFVVPLDGSARSEHALTEAVALATALDGEVTLLQAVNPVVLGAGFASATDRAQVLERSADHLRHELEARAATLPVPATVQTSTEDARTAILGATKEADLVILASHGRWGARRVLLGSVADTVLRGAEGPVMIVRVHPPPRRGWDDALQERIATWRARIDAYLRRLGI